MIKRTPQEIADFFGCYVAQNEKGRWKLYCAKPILFKGMDNKIDWDSDYDQAPIMGCTVDIPADHDCKHLYEPHGKEGKTEENFPNPDNKSESCYSDQADSDNNPGAPKEYAIVEGKRTQDLAGKVNVMLNHGWKPQGGIAVEYLPESDGYKEGSEIFYQAMVKGVYMGFPDSAGL